MIAGYCRSPGWGAGAQLHPGPATGPVVHVSLIDSGSGSHRKSEEDG